MAGSADHTWVRPKQNFTNAHSIQDNIIEVRNPGPDRYAIPNHPYNLRSNPRHDAPTASQVYLDTPPPPQLRPMPPAQHDIQGATRYKDSVGRSKDVYMPIKLGTTEKGLCIILANYTDSIPGSVHDIQITEQLYDQLLHYTVIGGFTDHNWRNKRNVTLPGLVDLIGRVNHHYDEQVVLQGTEYDRIIIHLFSTGDQSYLHMGDGSVVPKVNILYEVANGVGNLQGQIPVAVFIHTYPSAPLTDEQKVPTCLTGDPALSSNIVGYMSCAEEVPGHDENELGSWPVHQYVGFARANHAQLHLTDIVHQVNQHAESQNVRPPFTCIEKDFKKLHLKMSPEICQRP